MQKADANIADKIPWFSEIYKKFVTIDFTKETIYSIIKENFRSRGR